MYIDVAMCLYMYMRTHALGKAGYSLEVHAYTRTYTRWYNRPTGALRRYTGGGDPTGPLYSPKPAHDSATDAGRGRQVPAHAHSDGAKPVASVVQRLGVQVYR